MKVGRILLTVGAAFGAFYAAGLFYEVDFAPAGCCGLAWPSHDPAAAERLAAAQDPKGLNAGVQHKAAVAVLTARPGEAVAWLRLAYADWLKHGGVMTEFSQHAFEMSYRIAPYAYRQAPSRIVFALANWSQLSPEGRKAAISEIQVARTAEPAEHDIWSAIRAAVRQGPLDASGRMTAALLGVI